MYIEEREEWQTIKNYEGFYQINTKGEIRSLYKRNYHELISKRIDRGGYWTVRLCKKGKNSTKYLHRLLAFTFKEIPEGKCCVNHINGNKLDYRLDNLEIVTHRENMIHAYANKLISVKCKAVIDNCTGEIYLSIKEAAKAINISYGTCRNYLNGNIKTNKTCLSLAS